MKYLITIETVVEASSLEKAEQIARKIADYTDDQPEVDVEETTCEACEHPE